MCFILRKGKQCLEKKYYGNGATLNVNYAVQHIRPVSTAGADACVLICNTGQEQIENSEKVDIHHWRCLNDSMWSQVPAVQVVVCAG